MGHSQGGTQVLSGIADRPDYYLNSLKVAQIIASPSRIDRNTHRNYKGLISMFESSSEHPMQPPKAILRLLEKFPGLFDKVLKHSTDPDPSLMSDIGKHVWLGHSAGGCSVRGLRHFRQILDAKRFQKYDFGAEGNKEAYGSDTPPEIDLQSFSNAPIAMFYGQ